ncbi:MAG: hydrogenase 2 operon protein HybA [Thermodesulfobacteriota bacterium]
MNIRRRDFLKGVAGGTVLAATGQASTALAAEKKMPEGAVGILYDATLCIGCMSCMVACKQANDMPYEHAGSEIIYDNPQDLSASTLNVIKKYADGNGSVKDRETDGYSFVKRHCMHCVDPGCVSACPVSAMSKDPVNGIVSYDEKKCIGCRYCQVACPYNIPKFQWASAFPRLHKCQLCSHLVKQGGISACCGGCPTGASIFGPVTELLAEAKRRMGMTAGQAYTFPIGEVGAPLRTERNAASYVPKIYGEHEVGGAQVLLLAGVPFDKLGMPELPDTSYASIAEGIQHTLYRGMVLPAVLLAGLAYVVRKNSKDTDGAGNNQDRRPPA